jgi:hypothetical protein
MLWPARRSRIDEYYKYEYIQNTSQASKLYQHFVFACLTVRKNACQWHQVDRLKIKLCFIILGSLDESNFCFHLWVKVTLIVLWTVFFVKKSKNMTQLSLTFLHSALSSTEQRKENKTNHDPLTLLQQ